MPHTFPHSAFDPAAGAPAEHRAPFNPTADLFGIPVVDDSNLRRDEFYVTNPAIFEIENRIAGATDQLLADLATDDDSGEVGGDIRFSQVVDLLVDMHDRKQSDYGRENDPYANVRASEDYGIEGWVGALVRANDKMRRLQKASRGGDLANESVWDSLLDLAVYAVIAAVLFDEQLPADERKLA